MGKEKGKGQYCGRAGEGCTRCRREMCNVLTDGDDDGF